VASGSAAFGEAGSYCYVEGSANEPGILREMGEAGCPSLVCAPTCFPENARRQTFVETDVVVCSGSGDLGTLAGARRAVVGMERGVAVVAVGYYTHDELN